jgi:hypothetical protein
MRIWIAGQNTDKDWKLFSRTNTSKKNEALLPIWSWRYLKASLVLSSHQFVEVELSGKNRIMLLNALIQKLLCCYDWLLQQRLKFHHFHHPRHFAGSVAFQNTVWIQHPAIVKKHDFQNVFWNPEFQPNGPFHNSIIIYSINENTYLKTNI